MDNDDEGFDDQFDDELDDDEEPKKKKRVATSTKIVLVVAGWLLLTLFLVGEFSENKNKPDTASAELQTTEEFDDGGTPDIVDTEAEAEFDLDGDGFLDETERSAALEAFEASVEAGEVAIGESDVSDSDGSGSGDGTYPGPDGATAETAVPGAAPASGSGSSTTTTAKPSGGGASPTTTAAPTTTKPGNAPTTTTSPTTTAPPPPPPSGQAETYTVTAKNGAYVYAGSDVGTLVLFRGSKITFDNTEGNNGTYHSFTIDGVWDSGRIRSSDPARTMPDPLSPGTYRFYCTEHSSMEGTLRVT